MNVDFEVLVLLVGCFSRLQEGGNHPETPGFAFWVFF